MATVTVSASTTLAALGYSAGDDISITGSAELLVDADPSALPAIRSIRSSSTQARFKVRNSATAFSAGNMWRLNFENGGTVTGANGSLSFTAGATLDIEGEWLTCYTAAGTATETILDASNVLGVDVDFPYCIQAETSPGSGIYKTVPIALIGGVGNGYLTTTTKSLFGTGDVGKVLFYDHTTRLLTTGDGTNGSLWPAGTKFRIPNVYIHIPPFTLTTGAWTTGTGSQPVTSSANAPIGGNPTYLVGSEIITVNSLPSGTAVNVSTRAQDGTTATAHAAGTVMYYLQGQGGQAGRLITNPSGVVRLKNCFFGRWWYLLPWVTAEFTMDGSGASNGATNGGIFAYGGNGPITIRRSVMYHMAQRVLHLGGNISQNASPYLGRLTFDDVLCVANYSSAFPQTYSVGNSIFAFGQAMDVGQIDQIRVWRLGLPAGVSVSNAFLSAQLGTQSTFSCQTASGFELVGAGIDIAGGSGVTMSNIRYSATNGANNVTSNDVMIRFNAGTGFTMFDFDVMPGGYAPRGGWWTINAAASSITIHNKVGGSIKNVDCQNRVAMLGELRGADALCACARFDNLRSDTNTKLSTSQAASATVRALFIEEVPGTGQVTYGIHPGPGLKVDVPGVPVSSATAFNPNVRDVQAVYAAPNTWPSLLGGIYCGPFGPEGALDIYDFTGSAYVNLSGALFIENSGDTIIIKATRPVVGISSIPGTAPQFFGTSPSTGLTYDFRLCNWGADITAAAWASFTGANVQSAFDALTGYSVYTGLNFQLRITATTTVAGRNVQQLYVPAQIDTNYNPPVGTVPVTVVGAANGALMAIYVASTLRGTATVSGGTATVQSPYDYDGGSVTYNLKLRELSHESADITASYAKLGATVPAPMAPLVGYVAGPYPSVSFNKATKTATVSAAITAQQLWSAWREYIVQIANFDVDDDWTYPELNAGTWEVAFSGAGSITGSYTDVNGTRAPITAPNLPVGARVQFYNDTDNVELTNEVLASAGASTSLYFTSAKTIRLRAAKLGSLPIEAFGVMTASGLTFIDEFVDDDVYNAKAIDGSTVTEFTADEPNVQIDSDDPDGVSSVWRCYAWFRYYETSSLGIAGNLFGAANAIDTENLAIDSSRANIQLDNVSAVPLKINDGYMYRTDGATIISPTSGSIQMDPKKAYSATGSGGGGATAEEIWTHPSRTLVPVGGVTNLY